MSATVSLRLGTGQLFGDIPIPDTEITLAEFIDATLKDLESKCLLSLPETDDELIDMQDFCVYDDAKELAFPLDSKLVNIPYLSSGDSQTTPTLVLESSIFRSAVEVEIDTKVDRIRRETYGPQSRPPYPPTRSISLEAKGMTKDTLLYLAGRRDYSLSTSPGQQQLARSPESFSISDIGSINIAEDMFEQLLTTAGSSYSLSQMSDDTTSILSQGSQTSEVLPLPEAVQHLRRSGLRPSSAPSTSGHRMQVIVAEAEPSTDQQPSHPRQHSADTSLLHSISPSSTHESLSQASEDLLISPSSPVPPQVVVPPYLEEPPMTPPTPIVNADGTFDEQPDFSNAFPNQENSKLGRKVRLASRRTSGLAVDSRRGSGDDPINRLSQGTINRTTIRAQRPGSVVISPTHAAKVYGNIKMFLIQFFIPAANLTLELDIRGDYTVAQIKESLWSTLREQGNIIQEFDFLWDSEKYTFTYSMNQETYELYDEQQIFQTSTVAQLWHQEKRSPCVLTVEQKRDESREEKTMNIAISSMIGIGLYQLQFANNDELDTTRRKMVGVRRQAVSSRDPMMYSMETEITYSAISPHIREAIGPEEKILVKVYYKAGRSKTFQVDLHITGDELHELAFPTEPNKRKILGLPEECEMDDFILKVAGRNSYIQGYNELLQFSQVVKALSKRQDVELALVNKLDTSLDLPRQIPDSNLIDDSTGLTGTHEELSALSKEHTQVFTMSMWDIQRKFRVRVVGLDNLRNAAPEVDVLYIEVGVYHGGEMLCSSKFTDEVPLTRYPRWNQWLVFDIAVKNLPKAARLSISVLGGSRKSDVKKRGSGSSRGRRDVSRQTLTKDLIMTDRPLHWVNMQILDHRALLRQALLKLNLWPAPAEGSAGISSVGSTAVNPDGNNAAILYIELDSYSHPVACPTAGWGAADQAVVWEHSQTKEGSPFKFRNDLEKSISLDPLAPLNKAQRELLWNFREQIKHMPEAMPKFLRVVEWSNLDQVTEVHRLLKIWAPVTMEVALELLDYHFADEKVRSLAVKRLEKLTNDELLIFLLQLIQVLKFEPYHDSALARLLLKRALKSKRIGHFFFWYLRSEMDTSEFCQRFGILLEAYLRGCGEAKFKELQVQHKVLDNIMSVAAGLKKQQHKSVTEYVKEELRNFNLTSTFSPPYDPGLTMGQVDLNKCRVMDSKKTPLWLEFQNMDPTVVDGRRSIKIIAKNGDDLRQDMLTLQMLSLMDNLWQSRGLDLHIISYGCIATGHNVGVIEVVQDAETVAKIQLHHGGSFSTLKDEPLHDWLKKKNPTPKHFEKAVERFMLSCAGYCVATYVLGIGDRHNDNIMVTTGGNLFHIDFGHFLGNTKAFLGMNRERAPFVLTPDFEYVLGKRHSELFKKFEDTAVKAYLVIRTNANLFINLFSMMKCTGIPELRSVEDLEYLRSVLVLDKTEEQAAEHFRQQIHKCLRLQWSTQLSWLAHNFVHRSS